jgi:hypothetical protein
MEAARPHLNYLFTSFGLALRTPSAKQPSTRATLFGEDSLGSLAEYFLRNDSVSQGYKWLLGREPESENTVFRHLKASGGDWRRLRANIMRSPEFQKGVAIPLAGPETGSGPGLKGRNAGTSAGEDVSGLVPREVEEILFVQTADPVRYRPILQIASETVLEYCGRHDLRYEFILGVVRGYFPWQATYNRIPILRRILNSDFQGWICYLDADTFIADLDFDLRNYLKDKTHFGMIASRARPISSWWKVNAGVLLLNLAHPTGRAIVSRWNSLFDLITDDQLRKAEVWGDVTNEQGLLWEALQSIPDAEKHTFLDDQKAPILNYSNARFIRQVLRAVGTPSERFDRIKADVRKVLDARAGTLAVDS